MHSKRRRRLRSYRWLAITLIVVIGLGVSGTAIGYLGLKPRLDALQANLAADLEAGQSALEAGKTALTQASSKHDPTLVTQANADFVSANGHFMAASHLADNSNLLRYAEQTPGLGDFARTRHSVVDGIAQMGAGIANAGLAVTSLYSQLIKPQPASPNVLTVLNEVQAAVPTLRSDLQRAQAGAAQVDPQVLPSGQQAAFTKARDTIASGLAGLDELDRLAPALTDILGGNGLCTYLIEQVNPSELRAGGGFIGSYSLVQANQGKLTLIRSGNATDLAEPRPLPGQPGFIPQLGPYREVIPDISWSFLDSNLYPDFASNAKAALSFVQPRLAFRIDGVFSVDYYTVAKMLDLTGPVAVPSYGLTVDANTFIPQLMTKDVAGAPDRKDILSAIAGTIMQRLTSLPADGWLALIASLTTLATERHIQAYFDKDSVEQEINRLGWSGSVNPAGAQDFMMEVESNYWGDKVNYFVTRRYTVVLIRNGGTLHHQVTVDLVNNEPCDAEARTSYRVDVRMYVGQTASSLSDNLRAVAYPNPDPPAGTELLDGWLPDIVCAGGTGSAQFSYDTPWTGADSIYWQNQPGTQADKVDVNWSDDTSHLLKVSGVLGQDRVISVSPGRLFLTSGDPAQAQLPSLGLG